MDKRLTCLPGFHCTPFASCILLIAISIFNFSVVKAGGQLSDYKPGNTAEVSFNRITEPEGNNYINDKLFVLRMSEKDFRLLLDTRTRRAQIAFQFCTVDDKITLRAWAGRRNHRFADTTTVLTTDEPTTLPSNNVSFSVQKLLKDDIENLKKELTPIQDDQSLYFYPKFDEDENLYYGIAVLMNNDPMNKDPMNKDSKDTVASASSTSISMQVRVVASTNPSPPGRFSNTSKLLF